MWMVKSPLPIVSLPATNVPSETEWIGNMDLPLGVAFEDSVLKSPTVPNGTG